jgi:predicted Fe-Mo cluster-binding NifX family protein
MMRIALPVEDKSMQANVCQSFGRTPYFLIYSTGSGDAEFLANSAAGSQGGAGIKAAQLLVDHGVHALLTPRCGENAADVLQSADIQIYKTSSSSIQANIEAYKDSKLETLTDVHPGFHNHRGR